MLKITKDTTDAQILARVVFQKQQLLESAMEATTNDAFQGELLVGRAQSVRTAEAVAAAQFNYRSMIRGGNSEVHLLGYLFDVIAQGDDTYSGRGNDSKRSARDGVVAWAREEVSAIRYAR